MVTTEPTKKRKMPPTFQHFPINRAKKLKKTWIENNKIKNKWKAEKRKAGLVSKPSEPQPDLGSEREEIETQQEDTNSSNGSEETQELENDRPESTLKSVSRAQNFPQPDRKPNHNNTAPSERTPDSLRELTRKAYSRESLHSFKADPLGRHRGRGKTNQRGGGGGRGQWRGNHDERRGRGQPNMKLRMTDMLEKIKRDLS